MNSENVFQIVVGAGFTDDDRFICGETFYVSTNAKTRSELQEAYLAGVKKTGVDVQKDCDGSIGVEDFQKIKNLAFEGDLTAKADPELAANTNHVIELFDDEELKEGIEGESPFYWVKGSNGTFLTSWTHYQLWRAVARIGNPSLTMKLCEPLSLNIGGESKV